MATTKQTTAVFTALNVEAVALMKQLIPEFLPPMMAFEEADIERKAMTLLSQHPEWVNAMSGSAIKAYEGAA